MRGAHSFGGQKSSPHFHSQGRERLLPGGGGGRGGGGPSNAANGSDDVPMSSSRRVADFDMKILQQKKQEAEVKRSDNTLTHKRSLFLYKIDITRIAVINAYIIFTKDMKG